MVHHGIPTMRRTIQQLRPSATPMTTAQIVLVLSCLRVLRSQAVKSVARAVRMWALALQHQRSDSEPTPARPPSALPPPLCTVDLRGRWCSSSCPQLRINPQTLLRPLAGLREDADDRPALLQPLLDEHERWVGHAGEGSPLVHGGLRREVVLARGDGHHAADAAPARNGHLIEAPWVSKPPTVAGERRARRLNGNRWTHRSGESSTKVP
jgi:hypothetical protein